MATFPRTEAEIATLAQEMVTGLTANAVLYPSLPIIPTTLQTLLTAYTDNKDDRAADRGHAGRSAKRTGTGIQGNSNKQSRRRPAIQHRDGSNVI